MLFRSSCGRCDWLHRIALLQHVYHWRCCATIDSVVSSNNNRSTARLAVAVAALVLLTFSSVLPSPSSPRRSIAEGSAPVSAHINRCCSAAATSGAQHVSLSQSPRSCSSPSALCSTNQQGCRTVLASQPPSSLFLPLSTMSITVAAKHWRS